MTEQVMEGGRWQKAVAQQCSTNFNLLPPNPTILNNIQPIFHIKNLGLNTFFFLFGFFKSA